MNIDPKVWAAMYGKYVAPDRYDNLPEIIRQVSELVRHAPVPGTALPDLTRLIREATDLLQAIRSETSDRTSDNASAPPETDREPR